MITKLFKGYNLGTMAIAHGMAWNELYKLRKCPTKKGLIPVTSYVLISTWIAPIYIPYASILNGKLTCVPTYCQVCTSTNCPVHSRINN